MKLIIKIIMPLLALILLVSGRPIDKKIVAKATLPTTVWVTIDNSEGSVCSGSSTLCLNWSGGTLAAAKIVVNGGFTILSKNPNDVCCGSHCWNISIGNDSVFFIIEGSEDGSNWTTLISGCRPNCNGHECF
jgi:hypothetical protein